MNLTIADVRLTPILVADPPLLNTQGVHQPYTPRLIVEVETADGITGVGETYGDTKYLELARPFARQSVGRRVSDLNGLFSVADEVAVDRNRVSGQVDVGGLHGVQTADKLRLSAVSGFEVACLDALGKALGLPVHALLGGKVRDAVEYGAYLFYPWQSEDVLTERLTFEAGKVAVPDGPGLGVELDRTRLAELHRRWLDDDGTLRDRDDAAAMRVAEPGWATPAVPRW